MPALTPEQHRAFEALNTLQMSTDQMNRMYSTFANINQPFYPADTSFVITQSELLNFLKIFISQNCQNLAQDRQQELATTAVLAQEEYTVLSCPGSIQPPDFDHGLPMIGTWVIPNILERRDVIMIWY